jgi:hypothetical protein
MNMPTRFRELVAVGRDRLIRATMPPSSSETGSHREFHLAAIPSRASERKKEVARLLGELCSKFNMYISDHFATNR